MISMEVCTASHSAQFKNKSSVAAVGSLEIPNRAEATFRRSSLSESDKRVSRLKAEIAAREKDDLEIIKRDVCDWLSKTLEIDVPPDGFMDTLDTGVVLCKLAKLIQDETKCAREAGEKVTVNVPMETVRCQPNAKKGTFFARDNTANFIKWCKKLGVNEEVIFESNGLVQRQDEKRVILCLIDVSRFAHKVNIRPPELVRLENEIEMLELDTDLDESVFEEPAATDRDDTKMESPRTSSLSSRSSNSAESVDEQLQAVDEAVEILEPLKLGGKEVVEVASKAERLEPQEDKELIRESSSVNDKGDIDIQELMRQELEQSEEKSVETSKQNGKKPIIKQHIVKSKPELGRQSPKLDRLGAVSPNKLKKKKTTPKSSPRHSPHRSPGHRSRETKTSSPPKRQQPKKQEPPPEPPLEQKTDELVS